MRQCARIVGGRVCLAASLLWTVTIAAASEPALKVFQKHAEAIRSAGLYSTEGFLFAAGRVAPSSASANAEIVAERRAESAATEALFDWQTNQVEWPAAFPRSLAARLWSSYRRVGMSPIVLQGLQLVDRRKGIDGTIETIVALPSPESQLPSCRFVDISSALLNALKRGDKGLDVLAVMELCPEADLPKAIVLLAEKAGRDFGPAVAATIRGTPLSSINSLRGVDPNTDPVGPEKSLGDLWAQLEATPYHPAVCRRLGEALRSSGMHLASDIMYARGASVWPRASASQACQLARKSHAPLPVVDRRIPENLWDQMTSRPPRELERLGTAGRLIVLSLGELPVSGDTAENELLQQSRALFFGNPPDLTGALSNAVASLESSLTADGCNLAGRCLMLTGQERLAAPFFAQALRLAPNHPYAGENLRAAINWLRSNR